MITKLAGSNEALKEKIRDIADFPTPGILFKDITTLLKDPVALRQSIQEMKQLCQEYPADAIVGIESRGFIFGTALAHELGLGFIPVRKPGKLPAETARHDYMTEYSNDSMEIHLDAITPAKRFIIVDDLLATGGTARAAAELIEKLGGTVAGFVFLIELSFLNGRQKLEQYQVSSVLDYSE